MNNQQSNQGAAQNSTTFTSSNGSATISGGGTGLSNTTNITNSSITLNGYMCASCGSWINGNSLHACNGSPQGTLTVSPGLTGGYVNVTSEGHITTTLDSILNVRKLYGQQGKCSKCKKVRSLSMSYKLIAVERHLCEECLLGAVDKLFGVESNVVLEKTLYGKD